MSQIHVLRLLADVSTRLVQDTQDLVRFVVDGNRLKVSILICCSRLTVCEVGCRFELKVILGEMIIEDDTNTLPVYGPDLLVLMYVTVETQHVEEDIDCQDWITTCMEQAGFLFLAFDFVAFKEL